MKTTIKIIALLVAAGYPCVAFAEFLGAPVPAAVNLENAAGIFVAAMAGLMFIGDYTRRLGDLHARACKPVCTRNRQTHRLAA